MKIFGFLTIVSAISAKEMSSSCSLISTVFLLNGIPTIPVTNHCKRAFIPPYGRIFLGSAPSGTPLLEHKRPSCGVV